MLFDLYCLQDVNCLTFLENLETDSGTCRMIASDLWRTMEVDVGVSLKTCLCISGEVLDFLYHFFFHDKLVTRASLWDTCHVTFAYAQNLFNTFHHGVFPFLVRLLQIVFQFLKSVFGSHFYKFLARKVLHNFCSSWSICCNVLLNHLKFHT